MSDEQIQQFMMLTNSSAEVARKFLGEHEDDLEDALNGFYANQQRPESGEGQRNSYSDANSSQGPRSSSPQLPSQASARSGGSSGRSKKEKPRFRTFSQIMKESQEDDDDDEARHTFAGGETSGLEVTDPNDSNSLIRDLLEKARKGGERGDNGQERSVAARNFFKGRGYRLGSSADAEPEVVAQPEEPERPRKVTREITFWKEGFQVGEDGPLYRYDDPANSYYLNELNQGRAPLRLLNVEFGQEVDVNVYKKLDESYKPPKKSHGGFSGSGRRLGSPIPGDMARAEEAEQESAATTPVPEAKQETPKPAEQQGNTSVQIRYASGKREVLRCNNTDKVRFLYDHVKENTSETRPFTLNQVCPVQPLEDFECTIGEQNLCNSVVVQRWV
ncbi:AaceriABR211Cp [[Ashbya] aceris (nom. inval.)]|nr:AaceriABR211Cp [[Ashbya] aceris (nom. inval.)]